MAKVFMFPQKKKLPNGVEERMKEIAKEYVEVLYAAATIMALETDKPTYEEVLEMIGEAFTKGIEEAVDGLD